MSMHIALRRCLYPIDGSCMRLFIWSSPVLLRENFICILILRNQTFKNQEPCDWNVYCQTVLWFQEWPNPHFFSVKNCVMELSFASALHKAISISKILYVSMICPNYRLLNVSYHIWHWYSAVSLFPYFSSNLLYLRLWFALFLYIFIVQYFHKA